MLRKNTNPSSLEQLTGSSEITEQLANIRHHAEIVEPAAKTLGFKDANSIVHGLMEAIDAFEESKYDDYFENDTENMEFLLFAANLYNDICDGQLSKNYHIRDHAENLKNALTPYIASVTRLYNQIKSEATAAELADDLRFNLAKNEMLMNLDLLSNELWHYNLAYQAKTLAEQAAEASVTAEYVDPSYDGYATETETYSEVEPFFSSEFDFDPDDIPNDFDYESSSSECVNFVSDDEDAELSWGDLSETEEVSWELAEEYRYNRLSESSRSISTSRDSLFGSSYESSSESIDYQPASLRR